MSSHNEEHCTTQQQQQYPAQMPEIWRLLIVHRTVLSYPDTVTTSYNEVRIQPSDEPGQAVLSARLEIDPFEGVLSYIDYFGTRVRRSTSTGRTGTRRHRHHHGGDLPTDRELAGRDPPGFERGTDARQRR